MVWQLMVNKKRRNRAVLEGPRFPDAMGYRSWQSSVETTYFPNHIPPASIDSQAVAMLEQNNLSLRASALVQ